MRTLARRGIPLQDREFFQFHPTGIKDLGVLITEAVRGEGGMLRNREGVRFMERYAPTLLDLAPRDMVSRAIATEIKEGNGICGDGRIDDYVNLDATHLGENVVKAKLPDIADFCKTYLGIDPAHDPIPVHPTAHYAMGGIPTDIDGRVLADGEGELYEGLFAAGECACVSVHGANRLGTNSLVDLVVFGRKTGKQISQYAKEADFCSLPDNLYEEAKAGIDRLTDGKGDIQSGHLREQLQRVMMEKVGIYRNEAEMADAVSKVSALREQYQGVRVQDRSSLYNTELQEVLELGNLLDLALITASSAVNRQESRGAHARDDFPERDDGNWLKHTLAWLESGSVRLAYRPVDASVWEPKPRIY
jgi:succinate dehydrogenase / fumarate reductase flavoprotein subunit